MLVDNNLDKLPEGADSTLSYGEIKKKYVKTKLNKNRNGLDQESGYLSLIWTESQSLTSI